MTLNTFWFRRMQSALKTHSVDAGLVHWRITSYRLVSLSALMSDVAAAVPSGAVGWSACELLKKYANAEHGNLAFDSWASFAFHEEPNLSCTICNDAAVSCIREHGYAQWLKGCARM